MEISFTYQEVSRHARVGSADCIFKHSLLVNVRYEDVVEFAPLVVLEVAQVSPIMARCRYSRMDPHGEQLVRRFVHVVVRRVDVLAENLRLSLKS